MNQTNQTLQQIVRFVFISGMGWLCDMSTYILLTLIFTLDAQYANFISSYVGLLFVYFTSLQYVFNKKGKQSSKFLMTYWLYHLGSISLYSYILHTVITLLPAALNDGYRDMCGKVIITPFNLATNFLFMKILSIKMRHSTDE